MISGMRSRRPVISAFIRFHAVPRACPPVTRISSTGSPAAAERRNRRLPSLPARKEHRRPLNNITGTLTIKSQALAKTAAHTPLENHLFIVPGIETVSNFDTIELYKQVYCSYTETERNSIFGTGAAYTSLDGAETYTAASCSD